MKEPAILSEAEFESSLKWYMVLSPVIVLTCSIILIPIVPIVFGIMWLIVDRYIARLKCTLTERNLQVKKGLLVRVEQTIPLEKITDLQMYQGPIMRFMGLHGFRVETAGQSGVGGHLMSLIGIVDTPGFRARVLDQRDLMSHRSGDSYGDGAASSGVGSGETDVVLRDIRDCLVRIEQRLGERDGDTS